MESTARVIYPDSKILDILSEIKAISPDSRQLLEKFMSKWGLDAYDAVVETNIISDEDLKNILANHFGLPSIDAVGTICTSEDCISTIDFQHAIKWYVVPMGILDSGRKKTIKLVISDPTSEVMKNEIKKQTGCLIDLVIGTRREIHTAIFKDYPVEQQMPFVCGVSKGADL